MLGNMNVFMAVLGIILFSGFLAAYSATNGMTNEREDPSPNRPLVTVVYKGPDDGEKKPPVNRR